VNSSHITADKVFLATGSHPKDDQLYPGLTILQLDDALIPSKLSGRSWMDMHHQPVIVHLCSCNIKCLCPKL